MAPKYFLRTAVAATLLATGLAAQAGTLTYNGAYYGGFNNVAVTTPLPYTGGPAGGFKVTLSGFGNAAFDGQAFEAYCVDVSEYIGTSSNYSLMTAVDYFTSAAKVEQLGKLISYVYGNDIFGGAGVDKDAQSTALQLAVWNIVYDTDSVNATTALTNGTFKGSITSATGTHMSAQALLTNSSAMSAGAYDLYVLASGQPLNLAGNKQDQLIWKEAPGRRRDLPEPASLALVALALGGAGLASRRRRA